MCFPVVDDDVARTLRGEWMPSQPNSLKFADEFALIKEHDIILLGLDIWHRLTKLDSTQSSAKVSVIKNNGGFVRYTMLERIYVGVSVSKLFCKVANFFYYLHLHIITSFTGSGVQLYSSVILAIRVAILNIKTVWSWVILYEGFSWNNKFFDQIL